MVLSGNIAETTRHRHHAMQIVIAMSRKIEAFFGKKKVEAGAIFINKNVEHMNSGPMNSGFMVFVEPLSLWGDAIARAYDADFRVLEIGKRKKEELARAIADGGMEARSLISPLMAMLNVKMAVPSYDQRMGRLVGLIEALGPLGTAPGDLAREICLSESRMRHLFKLSEGISLKRYLLWKKLIDGVARILGGESFTRAAHDAGFSDSAHMSRTFRSMFGACPRTLLKDSRSVQVRFLNME